jgi:hypothetical protein
MIFDPASRVLSMVPACRPVKPDLQWRAFG